MPKVFNPMSDELYAKVCERLKNLEGGKRISMSLTAYKNQAERYEVLQAVKRYIDEYPQGEYCPIEISNDYQYVKKIKV